MTKPPSISGLSGRVHRRRAFLRQGRRSHPEACGLCDSGEHWRRKKEVLTIAIGENESGKYWLSVLNSLKKSGHKGPTDPLLWQPGRDQRGYRDDVSVNGAAEVHRPHGAEHAKIRRKQGYEGVCKRPEDNLHRVGWRNRLPPVGICDRKMGRTVPECDEPLNSSYLRLNHQRSVFLISQAFVRSPVSGNIWVREKMDSPDPKLGKNPGRACSHVPGRMPE